MTRSGPMVLTLKTAAQDFVIYIPGFLVRLARNARAVDEDIDGAVSICAAACLTLRSSVTSMVTTSTKPFERSARSRRLSADVGWRQAANTRQPSATYCLTNSNRDRDSCR